jgi:hypothetical protein
VTPVVKPRWLLLIHQIPPRPAYLRVKIGRRLQAVGAVAIKNSVYALPRGEQPMEDLQWVRREIVAGGGEATVCEALFVEGHSDAGVTALFNKARDADYAALAGEARALARTLPRPNRRGGDGGEAARPSLVRLRKRLAEIAAIDFFGAPGREAVDGLLSGIEARLQPPPASSGNEPKAVSLAGFRGRVWVTRRGIQVDRMASAWLIRRFIDRKARFKFVAGHDYGPARREVRFDMYQAEFTHDGDLCTFEVLLRRFGLDDPALGRLGEIVHDVDLKDGKFGRPEATGLDRLVAGIALLHSRDEARLAHGGAALDALYESFRRKP